MRRVRRPRAPVAGGGTLDGAVDDVALDGVGGQDQSLAGAHGQGLVDGVLVHVLAGGLHQGVDLLQETGTGRRTYIHQATKTPTTTKARVAPMMTMAGRTGSPCSA